MRGTRLKSVGYWSWGADPTQLVDASWAAGERDQLVQYLRSGHRCFTYFGYSFCRFQCGIAESDMGSSDLTDGTWMWPEGLWHYIADHMVALPGQFLDHARLHGFRIPELPARSAFDRETDDSVWHEWTTAEWQRRNPPA